METNKTNPDLMTPRERLCEASALLARGFLRLRAKRRRATPGTGGLAELDFPKEQSVYRVEPERGDQPWNPR